MPHTGSAAKCRSSLKEALIRNVMSVWLAQKQLIAGERCDEVQSAIWTQEVIGWSKRAECFSLFIKRTHLNKNILEYVHLSDDIQPIRLNLSHKNTPGKGNEHWAKRKHHSSMRKLISAVLGDRMALLMKHPASSFCPSGLWRTSRRTSSESLVACRGIVTVPQALLFIWE